jgi:hypothetical protein
MPLKRLTPEQREEICDIRVRGYNIKSTRREYYKNHSHIPEEDWFHYNTFRQYFQSARGREDLEKARERIRKNAPKGAYVHRGERLGLPVEDLGLLVDRLRSGSLDDRGLVMVSSEVRQVIKEIREESSPYDDVSDKNESPLEQFIRKVGTLSPKMQDLITEDPN